MSAGVKPAPPAPGAKPARLTTKEEECAGANASFAASLQCVGKKGSLDRFLAPTHDEGGTQTGERFSEEDLDRFMRSLDRMLMPAALRDADTARAVWRRFWAARMKHWDELRVRERGDPETLERTIVRSLLADDRAHLREAFVGRGGVEMEDLAYALWRSHEQGWLWLVTEGGSFTSDRLERARAGAARYGTRAALPHRGQTSAGGMKAYEAFALGARRRS